MSQQLPSLIAGPIARRFTPNELVLWFATSNDVMVNPQLYLADNHHVPINIDAVEHESFPIGTHAFVKLVTIKFATPLANDTEIEYDLISDTQSLLKDSLSTLTYDNKQRPSLVLKTDAQQVLHGSCRKPHHDEDDALIRVDGLLASAECHDRPSMLIMSGDQVYIDDVAGPMLSAIHQTIALLGLHSEQIPGALVENSEALINHPDGFYNRTELLPDVDSNEAVLDRFFLAKRKPIFTSVNAKNHLITASEVFAMYLLVWSPVIWQFIKIVKPKLSDELDELFEDEQETIERFVKTLPQTQRILAHIPCYMIFDDHDITDDWNLTRGWEEAAYGNPFSKRIIGNALLGYYLFQGLGNAPKNLHHLTSEIKSKFTESSLRDHDEVLQALFDWNHWHYTVGTNPPLMVLDTRTHRWRSEKNPNKPSGLMDWELLQEMREELRGKSEVIMVSAAPVFGVKIIEAIQKLFTMFGQALTVDAENWMAHEGTAKVLLETFHDPETPKDFVILSGDVHYSFCYDVRLRFKKDSPRITQITASGIKNQFPSKLIATLDKWNLRLYGPKSPLVWFTKRRKMKIRARYPNRKNKWRTLVSKSAIGLVQWPADRNKPIVKVLCHDGEDITFR